nr:MAG TPA: hypothetical protein [Caudoviricetes sp.]
MSTIETQLDSLTNHGMIDMMHHQWKRYESVNPTKKNKTSLWKKWIRL